MLCHLPSCRRCDEFDGEPLSHVFLHHSGRRLGVVTKRSRLLVLETKSLGRAQQFLGVRCRWRGSLGHLQIAMPPCGSLAYACGASCAVEEGDPRPGVQQALALYLRA